MRADDAIEAARRIHASQPVVDGHNDLPWALRSAGKADLAEIDLLARQPDFHTDIPRLLAGGVGAQFWSVWVPASDPAPLRSTIEQIDLVYRMAESYPDHLTIVDTAAAARECVRSKRIAGFLGAEGGHAIENSLGALRILFRLGVRYLTLTHTRTTDWADSATDEPRHGGLSPFGEEVVREMNRLGMLVDISHCSPDTMRAALEIGRAPIIASHSCASAIAPHPRNVPDDVIRGVADTGGVVMVCFYPPFVVRDTARVAIDLLASEQELRASGVSEEEIGRRHDRYWEEHPPDLGSTRDVVDHIEHIAGSAGVEHVGIGSDYDGMTLTPTDLEDASCYPHLTSELLRRGWAEPDIRKVLGENALRALEEAERVATSSRG